MRKIRIHPEMVKEIAMELNTTNTTVHASLSYYNNSELAEKIRQLAKEKLLQEAKSITESK